MPHHIIIWGQSSETCFENIFSKFSRCGLPILPRITHGISAGSITYADVTPQCLTLVAVGLQGAFLAISKVAKPLASELQLVAILADIKAR